MTGESVDLKRFSFLLTPTALAGVVEGDGAESPGGDVSAGVPAVDVAAVLARLGVAAVVVAVDSVAVEGAAGVTEVEGAFEDEIETIAGSCQVAGAGIDSATSTGASAGAGSSATLGVGEVHACAGSSSQVGPDAVVGSSHPAGSSLVVVGGDDGTGAGADGAEGSTMGALTDCEGRVDEAATVGAEGGADDFVVTGLGGSLGLDK